MSPSEISVDGDCGILFGNRRAELLLCQKQGAVNSMRRRVVWLDRQDARQQSLSASDVLGGLVGVSERDRLFGIDPRRAEKRHEKLWIELQGALEILKGLVRVGFS